MKSKIVFFLTVVLAALPLFAQAATPVPEKPAEKPEEPPAHFVKTHHIRLDGADVQYTTTAEEIILKDRAGKSTARFFTISYTKDGVPNPESRPLTFVFNGGPGSASIWLHFGVIGPRVIDIPSDAQDPGSPPYKMRDNPSTIFRATDLVFVDPVGTGYSRAAGEKKDEDFWGFDEDADSVAEFIRSFITQHGRWNSPKYLLGESYGGVRASLLVPRLQENLGIALNGVVIISPALNVATLPFFTQGNDQGYATSLPPMAATAFYHHKLGNEFPDIDTLMRQVEKFAEGDYLVALFRGDRIDPGEKQRIAAEMHRFLGLPTDYILRSDLRVHPFRFAKELLRDQGRMLGLLDARYSQKELDNIADLSPNEPFMIKTFPIYTALFQNYLRNELGVDFERRYMGGNPDAGAKWKRSASVASAFAGFADASAALAQGTKDNETMRVFAAGSYYDLVTSYFATEYNLDHAGIEASRYSMHIYPGGHMMYLYRPSAEALSADIVKFMSSEGSR